MFSKFFNVIHFKIIWKKTLKIMFKDHVFATNVISSGVLMGIGDLVQQEIEYKRHLKDDRIDYGRLGRMFTVGIIEGPIHVLYYGTLDKLLPGMDLVTVSKKIILDQTVASPLFIATFFYGMGILEGKSVIECTQEIRKNMWTVYMADWFVWPPTQFINFYLLPAQYRIVYINAVTMLYNVFLSYMKHRDSIGEHKASNKEQQDHVTVGTQIFRKVEQFIHSENNNNNQMRNIDEIKKEK